MKELDRFQQCLRLVIDDYTLNPDRARALLLCILLTLKKKGGLRPK